MPARTPWCRCGCEPILAARLAEAGLSQLFARRGNAADRRAGRAGVQRHQGRRGPAGRAEPAATAGTWSGWSRRSTTWPGSEFNIASPKQLQKVLFVEQKLPVVKRTAKTGPSTDVDVLEALAAQPSAAGQDRRVPAICQAQGHVCRCLAADGPSGDRPRPRLVQPGA